MVGKMMWKLTVNANCVRAMTDGSMLIATRLSLRRSQTPQMDHPRWVGCTLTRIRAGEIELWLRSLPFARSTCAKILNVRCRAKPFGGFAALLPHGHGAEQKPAIPKMLNPEEIIRP